MSIMNADMADKTIEMTESSNDVSTLFPPVEAGQMFVVACSASDFLPSRLARAVEDCDAHLVNMNVTEFGGNTSPVVAQIRTIGASRSDIIRSLERYGYFVEGEDDSTEADLFRQRVNEVLLYLNIK